MPVQAFGHTFTKHKSEEMICWACGYVIWLVDTGTEAEEAVREIEGGDEIHCGGAWHVTERRASMSRGEKQ
jgi:hypothetical protein